MSRKGTRSLTKWRVRQVFCSAAILVDGERQSEKLSQEQQIFESLCQLSLLHLSFIAPDVCVMDGRWRLFCANPPLSTDYVTSGAATTPSALFTPTPFCPEKRFFSFPRCTL